MFAALVFVGGALLLLLSGCHRSPSADVVATVNGKEILRSDLEENYQMSLGDNPQKPSPQEADIRRLNVLHQMIQEEIMQQTAAKLNLTASDEDVNARLTEIKTPYTEDQFNNLLKQRNMTLDDLKREIRRQLTETKLLNKEIESKINITDAQIADLLPAAQVGFQRSRAAIPPRANRGIHIARAAGRKPARQQSLWRCRRQEENRSTLQPAGKWAGFCHGCDEFLRGFAHGLKRRRSWASAPESALTLGPRSL